MVDTCWWHYVGMLGDFANSYYVEWACLSSTFLKHEGTMINNLAGGFATGMRNMTRSPSKPVGTTCWPMHAGDIMPGRC